MVLKGRGKHLGEVGGCLADHNASSAEEEYMSHQNLIVPLYSYSLLIGTE